MALGAKPGNENCYGENATMNLKYHIYICIENANQMGLTKEKDCIKKKEKKKKKKKNMANLHTIDRILKVTITEERRERRRGGRQRTRTNPSASVTLWRKIR